MKSTIIKILKYPLILLGIIIITSILFVLSQYLKDTFLLGPEPDLNGKSILFEAEGDGVQLFWRHYTENNEYTDEYLFDKPIPGDLSDVLLREDGLWFIVSEDINNSGSDIYIYKVFESEVEEISFFKGGGGHDLIRVSTTTDEFEVRERERDYKKDRMFETSTIYFEQNYLNTPDYNKLSVNIDTPSCSQGFGGFSLPCFFGYIKTDKLIRESDSSTLLKVRELATPMEVGIFGKRITSGVVTNTYFMFSKGEQYAFLFTNNVNNFDYRYTYLTDINSGRVMKISEGDVPVLMP